MKLTAPIAIIAVSFALAACGGGSSEDSGSAGGATGNGSATSESAPESTPSRDTGRYGY
jgi:hypothetical protein